MRTVLAMPSTVVENLRSAVYACHEELSAQVQADGGALACLVGSTGGSSPTMGPPPEEFYAGYGARAEVDYLAQLLADLAATTQINHQGLELRRRALAVAVGAPVLLAVVYGLVSVT
jgi:hypothetical protein